MMFTWNSIGTFVLPDTIASMGIIQKKDFAEMSYLFQNGKTVYIVNGVSMKHPTHWSVTAYDDDALVLERLDVATSELSQILYKIAGL
jgi:hypothetical protein